MLTPCAAAAASTLASAVTDKGVKKSLKIKSKRYRRGYTKALNRPRAPCSTPLLSTKRQRRWRSLSDIAGLLSIDSSVPDAAISSDTTIIQQDYQKLPDQPSCSEDISTSLPFIEDRSHRRRRLLSKSAKERLLEGRNRRMNFAAAAATPLLPSSNSNDSLATLKPTTSMSEFSVHSYHSGDPELEFD